jgi:hypothetical protein
MVRSANGRLIEDHTLTIIPPATAMVSGMAAYWKALEGRSLSPKEVKAKLKLYSWSRGKPDRQWPMEPPIVWNGEGGLFCSGNTDRSVAEYFHTNESALVMKRQDSGGVCTIDPSRTNPADSPTQKPTLAFAQGPPAPLCHSGCGKLCTDADYCTRPRPTGAGGSGSGDFWDPLDPRSPQNPSNPRYTSPAPTTSTGGGGGGPTPTSSWPAPLPTGPDPSDELKHNVVIYRRTNPDDKTDLESGWYIYGLGQGDPTTPCDYNIALRFIADLGVTGNPVFPPGDFQVTADTLQCHYTSTGGADPGFFSCPGFKNNVQCRYSQKNSNIDIPCVGDLKHKLVYLGICPWGDENEG